MKIKRYLANSEQEALDKIKSELGHDVIILGTQKVKKGGFLGFFAKTYLEVTVATDTYNKRYPSSGSNLVHNNKQPKEAQFQKLREMIEKKRQEYQSENQSKVVDNYATQAVSSQMGGQSQTIQEAVSSSSSAPFYPAAYSDLKQELDDTKSMMTDMMTEIRKRSFQAKLPEVPDKYYTRLLDDGVKEEIAQKLILQTVEALDHQEIEQENVFAGKLKHAISSNLTGPLESENSGMDDLSTQKGPNLKILIGPTGVGKTTTVAKLAAKYTLMDKMKVGLITIDTYRIAAVEQLKTYGDILSLPVEVVLTPQELKKAVQKFADKDIILVDTAGRSHKNDMQMTELKGFLETCAPSSTHLVLSLCTKQEDLKRIVDKYEEIQFNSFILTKVDETDTLGNVLNLLIEHQKQCYYLTTGQNVPDDLEKFDPKKIASTLVGEQNGE